MLCKSASQSTQNAEPIGFTPVNKEKETEATVGTHLTKLDR